MGRWRLPPGIDSHLVRSQGRNTHTDTHIETQTHTGTHRHTHRHTDTRTHAGHSVLASSTLVSTQQPVWFFQNRVRSHHSSVKSVLFGGENGGCHSDLPDPRAPGPGALCLCPVPGPLHTATAAPLPVLRQPSPPAQSPRASHPSRRVFSQTSTRLLQVTGHCFLFFPGSPIRKSWELLTPLPRLVFIHCTCHLIKYASICFLSLHSVLNINSMRIWLVSHTHTHTHNRYTWTGSKQLGQ